MSDSHGGAKRPRRIHRAARKGAGHQNTRGDAEPDAKPGDRLECSALINEGGEKCKHEEKRGDAFDCHGQSFGKSRASSGSPRATARHVSSGTILFFYFSTVRAPP